MISSLISVIITLVVLGLIYYCVTFLPIPEPFSMIIRVIFVLIAIAFLLSFLGLVPGGFLVKL